MGQNCKEFNKIGIEDNMKKRKDIQEQYKWDLSSIYANEEEWIKDMNIAKERAKDAAKYKGKFGNPASFLKALELQSELSIIWEKLYAYVSLWGDQNLGESRPTELKGVLNSTMVDAFKYNDYAEEEIKNLSKEYLESLLKDKRFKEYQLDILNYIRLKDHMLSEKECRIIRLSSSSGGFSQVFHSAVDADLKFEPALDSKGKKHAVTNSNIGTLLENSDRVLRRNVVESRQRGFRAIENTLSTNYISQVQEDWADAQIAYYDSVLQSEMFSDNLTRNVYNVLMKNIEKYMPLNDKYFKLRKRILGLSDYSSFDDYVPLVSLKSKYTYEQSMDIVKKALAVLGEDYEDILNKSYEQRWIDVYPNEGKRGGAYSCGIYDVHPFVLLNFEGRLDDVFTIAHELGHSAHSYYSAHNCSSCNHDYTIMCAEVASTVNEVLLLKYLYNNAKTKKEKIKYLDQYISEFEGTIFRQAMFSMFEDEAHRLVEQNMPISKDVLTETYTKLVSKFGSIKKDKNKRNILWMRIPHFYSCYYVYKYCLGFTSAVCIASNILAGKENSLENYKKYLKNGGKNFSLDTLKIAGIDLESDEPYKLAFAEMKWALSELDKLTK